MIKKSYFQHDTALVSQTAQIGKGSRIWAFSNIQSNVKMGENCNICDGCFIEEGVEIGNNVTIKNNVSLFKGISIADNVFIGANTVFINDRYPRSIPDRKWQLETTHIAKGVTIGSQSTIMCGLTIEAYAFIGAGSVVTKDIPQYTLVCGQPAKPIGYVCICGKKLNESYQCMCKRKYILSDKGLSIDE